MGERGCNHTSTHTHTRDFTNPPLPHCLPPHSQTKCSLPTSSLPSPLFLPERQQRDQGSWRGFLEMSFPNTFGPPPPIPWAVSFTHTHTLLPYLSSGLPAAPKALHLNAHRTPGVPTFNVPFHLPVGSMAKGIASWMSPAVLAHQHYCSTQPLSHPGAPFGEEPGSVGGGISAGHPHSPTPPWRWYLA